MVYLRLMNLYTSIGGANMLLIENTVVLTASSQDFSTALKGSAINLGILSSGFTASDSGFWKKKRGAAGLIWILCITGRFASGWRDRRRIDCINVRGGGWCVEGNR